MIKIIDNFLSKIDFRSVQNQFFDNPHFLWQFNPTRDSKYDRSNHNEREPFQFVHGLYRDFTPRSQYFDYTIPLLEKLKVRSIIRMKVNLTTRSESIIEGSFHVDHDFEHKTAIFYLNTNDGYTLFEDGTKVESVENRIVLFDGCLKHTGTNCTDKQRRVVLNINYF